MATATTEESPGRYSLQLGFAAAACPRCGRHAAEGSCPECGEQVPVAPEPNLATRARRAALADERERLGELQRSLDALPGPSVRITADALADACLDARLIPRAGDLYALGSALGKLDLDDPKMIGREVRRTVAHFIDGLAELVAECKDLAAFESDETGSGIQRFVLDLVRGGAAALAGVVDAVRAGTIAEARAAHARVEEILEAEPNWAELHRELDALGSTTGEDRLAFTLGRPGPFSDSDGVLDVGRLLTSFGSDTPPVHQIAQLTRRRFATVLGDQALDDASAAILVLPVAALSFVTNPLAAERALRQLAQSVLQAAVTDRGAVEQIAAELSDASGSTLAVHARAQRRIAAAVELGPGTLEEDGADGLLRAYQDLVEGPWRTMAWTAHRIGLIEIGQPDPGPKRPMVAELQARLTASGSPLQAKLATAVDRDLRNAVAHTQWRWDGNHVIDIETGSSWSPDEIGQRVDAVFDVLIPCDAGWLLGLTAAGIQLGMPAWLGRGESADGTRLTATLAFGLVAGATVTQVAPDGSQIQLAERREGLVVRRASSALVALAQAFPGCQEFTVTDADGEIVSKAYMSDINEYLSADAAVRDLASMAVAAGFAESVGHDRHKMAIELAANMLVVIVAGIAEEVQNEVSVQTRCLRAAVRLEFCATMLRQRRTRGDLVTRKVLDRLDRAAANSRLAAAGGAHAGQALAEQLPALTTWAIKYRGEFNTWAFSADPGALPPGAR